MLKISTWNRNGLLEVFTRKPIMVFYYKTTKGFVSRTVCKNRLRVNFETFITFSEPKTKESNIANLKESSLRVKSLITGEFLK